MRKLLPMAASWRLLLLAGVPLLAGAAWLCLRPGDELVRADPARQISDELRVAVERALVAARARPTAAERHGHMGLFYVANMLWPEASESLDRAATRDPGNPWWRYYRAIALRQMGRTEGTADLLRQVAQEVPESPAAQQRLGEALLEDGDPEGARGAFERVVALLPRAAEGHVGLGEAELALGRAGEAVPHLKRALDLDGSFRRAHYSLGLALRELGRGEEAKEHLDLGREAARRYLEDPLARQCSLLVAGSSAARHLAQSLLDQGRVEEAERYLTEALRSYPEDPRILRTLGVIALGRQDRARARELLERSLAQDPSDPSALLALGECSLVEGRLANARRYAAEAARLAPGLAQAHSLVAQVCLLQDDLEGARQWLERAVAQAPGNFVYLAALADVSARLGGTDVPRERLQQALEAARRQDPDHPAVATLQRLLEER